jgi:Flp pilus assembly protein TadD
MVTALEVQLREALRFRESDPRLLVQLAAVVASTGRAEEAELFLLISTEN